MAGKPRKTLTPKQLQAVKNHIAGHSKKQSCIMAGYSVNNAGKTAGLIFKNPHVVSILEQDKKELIEQGKYDREEAVKEINQDITDAKLANQYSAVASLRQLKMKAYGLLVEKHQIQQASFTVEIVRPEIDITPILTESKDDDDESQGGE